MKQKFKFNFGFLDRFKTKKPNSTHEDIPPVVDELQYSQDQSEYDSDISPEEFAEKTLGRFDLQKHKYHLENDNEENQMTETEDDFNQEESIPFQYKTSEPPEKPESIRKFKFKFPTLNKDTAKEKIKSTLANRSPMKTLDKLSWNDFILRLFSPYTRGKIHSIFIILVVITTTYMLGKNLALFLANHSPSLKRPDLFPLKKKQIPLFRISIKLLPLTFLILKNQINRLVPKKK